MSGTYMLKLEPGEVARVKEWVSTMPGFDRAEMSAQVPLHMGTRDTAARAYFSFHSNIVSIDYNVGELNGEWAIALGREILMRVRARGWGWDSVGYLSDDERARNGIPRPFGAQLRQAESSGFLVGAIRDLWLGDKRELQGQMETAAAALFASWPVEREQAVEL